MLCHARPRQDETAHAILGQGLVCVYIYELMVLKSKVQLALESILL